MGRRGWRPSIRNAAFVHVDGDAFDAVRRVFWSTGHFGPFAPRRMVAPASAAAAAPAHCPRPMGLFVSILEWLEGESPVCLLSTASPLRDVGVVLSHRLRFVDL